LNSMTTQVLHFSIDLMNLDVLGKTGLYVEQQTLPGFLKVLYEILNL
jgi:hypothetical protein